MKSTRITLILATLAAVFVLAACNGGDGDGTAVSDTLQQPEVFFFPAEFNTLEINRPGGSADIINSGDSTFIYFHNTISGKISGPAAMPLGDFRADFRFALSGSTERYYDFMFTADNRLIARSQDYVVKEIIMEEADFNELQESFRNAIGE